MPAQAATVSLAVQVASAVLKPKFRLATVPHAALSSWRMARPRLSGPAVAGVLGQTWSQVVPGRRAWANQ